MEQRKLLKLILAFGELTSASEHLPSAVMTKVGAAGLRNGSRDVLGPGLV